MEKDNNENCEYKDTLIEVLKQTQTEYAKSNKIKDKIIILLICLMFMEAVVGYAGFVWYESQFGIEDKVTTTEETTVTTEGENATIDYDNVEGDQYNDNAVHDEGGGK